MTTMHDDDGNEYDDDDNDGDNDDHDFYGHDELIMNIADSRVVLGTIVRGYSIQGFAIGTQTDFLTLH